MERITPLALKPFHKTPPRHNGGILFLLWSFAFLSYLLRTNVSVAQQYMAPELALTNIQIGYIFSAFLIGYTLFQVPAGMFGDRFGSRRVLAIAGLCCGLTTLLAGIVPGFLLKGATLALGSLIILRFLHGLSQAATYPVAMIAVAEWFDSSRHAFVNSLIFTGSTLGAALAGPLVAQIMSALGWRATFYATGVLPLIVAAFWWQESRGEGNSRLATGTTTSATSHWLRWKALLFRRDIFFLCFSYFLYCYAISMFVYWLYKYLVDVRHLSIVNGGWAASIPWLVASIFVPLLGRLSTQISRVRGNLVGRRSVAVGCLLLSSVLMGVGAGAESVTVAIGAISLSVGLLFSTESSYWSTAIEIAEGDAGAAGGLMNLAGNFGGVVSTMVVPVLATAFGWFPALLAGSVLAVLAAATWFLIRPHGKLPPSSPK